MDADWSVELGRDDATLEFPWTSADGSQGFVDLSRYVEAIATLPEVVQYPELVDFLTILNGNLSPWLTAKCDVWVDNDLSEAEEVYGAKSKVCSYVDLVRRKESERFSFEQHEQWVKSVASALRQVGMEHPIVCELIVRRCWFQADAPADDGSVPGFYVTLYLFGYGNDEAHARAMWGTGLSGVWAELVALQA